jgi:tRNA pseudouridine55 synthase
MTAIMAAETTTTMPAAIRSGVLNVNKPAGWTSHDVVARVRGVLRSGCGARVKVGHLGTLDPNATGVLPLCIGKATKIAQYLADSAKHYRAVMKLGVRTDTQDAAGRVLTSTEAIDLSLDQIETVCAQFVGAISQVPPMYSAVKIGGRPLYKAARAGLEVAREPRTVVISSLRVLAADGPLISLEIECSKGTYVRTLCADIGDRLGVGAHLARLERCRVGDLTLEGASTLEQVESAARAGTLASLMMPMERLLAHLPEIRVDDHTVGRVLHGVPLPGRADGPLTNGQSVRIASLTGELVAIGRVQSGGPRRNAAGTRPLDSSATMIRIDSVVRDRL